jgi:hypothetical protein
MDLADYDTSADGFAFQNFTHLPSPHATFSKAGDSARNFLCQNCSIFSFI